MTVLTVISAGLRVPSSTRNVADQLAAAARTSFEAAGRVVDVRFIDVRDHAHEIADALLTGFPSGSLRTALDDVAAADALIVVTPTFQGSYSGLFKSFADLFEVDSVRGTPVLLAATGGSERHSLVIEHALRPLFAYLGALAVPTGVYAATSDFGGPGASALTDRIARAARELSAITAGPAAAVPPPGAAVLAPPEAAVVATPGASRGATPGAAASVPPRLASVPPASAVPDFPEVTPFEQLLARAGH
ncbi:FMN reductase [Kineosphaera limosa]|uniref:Putative NAD(P)H-dependent FMN reductase n=1 Tax=Kineosphaera limosa NBRC 100340 TaxID=1184609 RepID=K6XAR7_9MICO|nr:CE1759 family FMN reductase [Kineosphaera limosa]NYE01304.1 FMN reductase [Kineosphaera limosa]GAB95899.1 putative NAD(P)H-dependent FMN reductase [Kineosphaera limosa NBRC 100340]